MASPSKKSKEVVRAGGEERVVRGRGGFHSSELVTIPENVTVLHVTDPLPGSKKIKVLCNFISMLPMKERLMHQYRVDFEPNVESESVRRRIWSQLAAELFPQRPIFDGGNDARSAHKLPADVEKEIPDPAGSGKNLKVKIRRVGEVVGQFEMTRIYNMLIKKHLKSLGFFLSTKGSYVHPELSRNVGNSGLMAMGGFRTSSNVHENERMLMNLESTHTLFQKDNLCQYMRQNQRCSKEEIRLQLTGKPVITNYNKVVYRVEDVDFTKTPLSTFLDKKHNREVSYRDYYKNVYNLTIQDLKQPLLLVVHNNKRRLGADKDREADIYLVPELCNIAGLTNAQREDFMLRRDLVQVSQIPPEERVKNLEIFLRKLHQNQEVQESLKQWGYKYGDSLLEVDAFILPRQKVGTASSINKKVNEWPDNVDLLTASFENGVTNDKCAVQPKCDKVAIIFHGKNPANHKLIMDKLGEGFKRVGLNMPSPKIFDLEGNDRAENYANQLRRMPNDLSLAIVIVPNQNKQKYDAIKKAASAERGLITQVVTEKLMMDQRKSRGASVKIAIQLVAKLGGEPWHINMPLSGFMICGYDTHHDTGTRRCSYGAFIASMNSKCSKWYSKADSHERLEEISNNMAQNVKDALERWNSLNGSYPHTVIIYRDGVGDGQLEHVFLIEMQQIKESVKQVNDAKIKFAFIVVNKRIGARFFWRNQNFTNCPPGTVIDNVVTRKKRFDFYLVSQSTRQGTITPTYYNIICDESNLDVAKHQAVAFKLCFAYYNWTGTVRVPAPCQYAHKLAFLCGEHLHTTPNSNLDDRLHYL